jgi:release factor glutamine methyltransferase
MNEKTWLLKEKYHNIESEEYVKDLERLDAGEPLAYIIGSLPFLDCTISLDSHPLIPRPETEFWTDLAIKQLHRSYGNTPITVLDLCAGSGAIGVAVAKHLPSAQIIFAEIDRTHLSTIKKNCEQNGIRSDRVTIVESDIFSEVSGSFNIILTNPPYIDEAANTVDHGVVTHEPHLALFGGTKGLAIIERIIVDAQSKLLPDGELWIEHEPFQRDAITVLAQNNNFSATTYTDQYHTDRYSILTPIVTK